MLVAFYIINFGSRFFLYNKVLEKTIENPMGFRVE